MKVMLIGFMGSGKSTVANQLSQKLSIANHDLDAMVEATAGMTIPEYFHRFGEVAFRQLEHQTLLHVLTLDGVLSTGGGTPVQAVNASAIASCAMPTVFLDASDETIIEHLSNDGINSRPLFQKLGKDGLLELKHARQARYQQLADITLAVDGQSPLYIAEALAVQLQSLTK